MPLPTEQLNMGQLTPMPANPARSLRDVLASLLGGWGSNNAAGAASSPYNDVSAQGLRDAVALPGTQSNTGAPDRVTAPQSAPYSPPEMGYELTNVTPPPAAVTPSRRRRPAPAYDTAAMDELTAALSASPVDGPSSRIDDATRQRALAWALRQNA